MSSSSTGSMPAARIRSLMRWRLVSCAAARPFAVAAFACVDPLSGIEMLRPRGEGHDVFLG